MDHEGIMHESGGRENQLCFSLLLRTVLSSKPDLKPEQRSVSFLVHAGMALDACMSFDDPD